MCIRDRIRTSYAQGTPNWVDLQTTNQDAAKAFYAGLFGWTYDDQPMPQGPVYSMAMLGGHPVAAIAPQSPELAAERGHRVHGPLRHGLVIVGPAEQAGVERLRGALVGGLQIDPVRRALGV